MRRGGWKVRMATDCGGSWEESPPSLIDVAVRDRRWAQGNLQHMKVIGAAGLSFTSRMHLGIGIMSYLSSPLWLLMLGIGFALAIQSHLIRPEYFNHDFQLFPTWPRFDVELMMALFWFSMVVLLIPKMLGLIHALLSRRIRRGSGGVIGVAASCLLEVILSALYAPILMMMQSRHVFEVFMGRDSGWKPQRRDGGGTTWCDAWHFHRRHMFSSFVTAVIVWFLSPPLLAWLSPALLGLFLAVPLSRASGSERLGGILVARGSAAHAGGSRHARVGRAPPGIGGPGAERCRATVCATWRAIARRASDAHQRQPGATRRPARPSRSARLHCRAEAQGCRSLEEALRWLTMIERVEVAGDARLLNQLALLPDAEHPTVSDLEDLTNMVRRRAILKSAVVLAAARCGPSCDSPPWAHHRPAQRRAPCRRDRRVCLSIMHGSRARPESSPATLSKPPRTLSPPAMAKLGYDQYQSLRFRTDHALWANAGLPFRLQFFHVGRSFTEAVRLYEVFDGQAREIVYDPAMFEFDKAGIDPALMRDHAGFAGFRVQFVTDWKDRCGRVPRCQLFSRGGRRYAAIRTVGARAGRGYRVSAAGGISALYLILVRAAGEGVGNPDHVRHDGLAEHCRCVAFSSRARRHLVMDIDSALYPRKAIERLGVAPLTSMFFYGENDRRGANDWRPEIHDSDGLSMWTGAGEWIWRPLTNPAQLHFNSYLDDNPRGFGLLQRDRVFDHYQDDGVYYDRRPSLWVEPKAGQGGWGKGSVQLVEIPTVDETFDNIVAFWNPAEKPKAGQELLFGYRLHWGTHMPYASPLAQTIATRTGIGGTVGQKRQYYSWHFAVDFSGGELGALAKDAPVEAVITTSRGQTEHVTAHYVEEIQRLPRAFRRQAAGRRHRGHRYAPVLAHRRAAADGNLDLSVDSAVLEGTQSGARLTRRAERDHMLPSRDHDAAGLFDGHGESLGRQHRQRRMDGNYDFGRIRRHVEHAAIHRIALVAAAIENPQLILVHRRIIGR